MFLRGKKNWNFCVFVCSINLEVKKIIINNISTMRRQVKTENYNTEYFNKKLLYYENKEIKTRLIFV